MGFMPPTTFQANTAPFGAQIASGHAVSLPDGIADGDLIVIAFLTQLGPVVSLSGYSLQGAALSFGTSKFSVYTKVWHTGDPTTFTATTTSSADYNYHLFLVRSSAAATINTDTNHSGSGTTRTDGKFSPATPSSDLRVLWLLQSSSTGVAPATPAVSANNPTQRKMIRMTSGGWGGNPTSSTPAVDTYYSLWEDPAGMDANDAAVTITSQSWLSRSMDFTDGTSVNGVGSADEIDLHETATVDVVATSTEQAGSDADSANANWWGGGTELLGDQD